MSGNEAPPITVVRPGDGPQGDLGAIGVVFKLWDRDTGGKLAIAGNQFPGRCARAAAPTHARG